MKRLKTSSSQSIDRTLQTAGEAWMRRDFHKNIQLLERATRLDPSNVGILLNLARSHGACYDYAATERCLEGAIRVAPNKAEVLTIACLHSIEIANGRLAEHYFQRALEQKDASSETFARLAENYESRHRFEEASRLVDRALQLDGSCARAHLIRAKLERHAGRLEQGESLLRPLLADTTTELQVRGYYELGRNLDCQGRYDEAMTALLEAKALLRPNALPIQTEMQRIRAYLKEVQEKLSAEMLQQWLDLASRLQPARRLAFLSGHVPSAHRLLKNILNSHPDVASVEKATVFYDHAYMPLMHTHPQGAPMLSILNSAQIGRLQQSRNDYFHFMQLRLGNEIGSRLLIDLNPAFNSLLPAFLRIFPETHLILALRDPRDVCLGYFMHPHLPVNAGNVSYLSLESTVESYVRAMRLWKTLVGLMKKPALEIRYEDLIQNPSAVSKRILDFLRLPPDDRAPSSDRIDPKQDDDSNLSTGHWRKYQTYLEPFFQSLDPFAKAFGYE